MVDFICQDKKKNILLANMRIILMSNPDEEEPAIEGKIIQEHLENINMDPWYYIYQVYVNPPTANKKNTKD